MITIPVHIVSRDFDVTESIQASVEKYAEQLVGVFDRIERCDVVISTPHHRSSKGRIYHIRVTLAVPGQNIVVSREPEKDRSHEDFYVAMRDAFRAARRKLKDHVAKMRDVSRGRDLTTPSAVTGE